MKEPGKIDIINTILSPSGFRLREYILIIISILLLVGMFVTLYNVETYKQECINHYESQMQGVGYYSVNSFDKNFSFNLNILSEENNYDGNKN
jgi:hypothetical protein